MCMGYCIINIYEVIWKKRKYKGYRNHIKATKQMQRRLKCLTLYGVKAKANQICFLDTFSIYSSNWAA